MDIVKLRSGLNRPLKITCVGEALVELSLNSDGTAAKVGCAGDTLNTAIYLKRALNNDDEVSFVTVLGTDRFSDQMISFMKAEDISTNGISRHPNQLPGLYAISKDDDGDRTFLYWRENSAATTLFINTHGKPDFSILDDADVIYLSAITLAILPVGTAHLLIDWLRDYRQEGGLVAFDSNYRPRLWQDARTAQIMIECAWSVTDIGLPSIDDEVLLYDNATESEVLGRLRGYSVPILVVKRGAMGPIAFHSGSPAETSCNFKPAKSVVDSTAAGDSFNGAFLAAISKSTSIPSAMLAGHAMAMKVIAHKGAIISKYAR